MSATERLCELLDERGVEHDSGEVSDQIWWKDSIGRVYFAKGEKTLMFFNLTPEQAIAATLGPSNCTNSERTNAECKPITYDNSYSTDHLEPGEYHEFWEPACACSECGELIPMRKFCPNCGRRIVEPTTNDVDAEVDA